MHTYLDLDWIKISIESYLTVADIFRCKDYQNHKSSHYHF